MAVMPTVKASSTPNPDDTMATLDPNADAMSPTTMIFKAMQDAGVPLNAGNIRRWVEAHARDTGEPDSPLVPGLRSNMPSQDEGPDVGQGGSSARAIEGTGKATTVPSKNVGVGPVDRDDTASETNKTTSAQPNEGMFVDPGTGMLDWGPALGLAGAGAVGAAGLGRQILAGNRPDAFRPVAPVDPMAIPNASQPGPMDTIDYSVMPPEGNAMNPMEQAFQRATEMAPRPTLGATPQLPPGAQPSIPTATVSTMGPPGMDIPGVPSNAPQVAPPEAPPPQMQFNRPRIGAPANVNQPTGSDLARAAARLFGRR